MVMGGAARSRPAESPAISGGCCGRVCVLIDTARDMALGYIAIGMG